MTLKKVREELNTLREQANDLSSGRYSGARDKLTEKIRRSYISQREHPGDRSLSIMDKVASQKITDMDEGAAHFIEKGEERMAIGLLAMALNIKDQVDAERGWLSWSKLEENR